MAHRDRTATIESYTFFELNGRRMGGLVGGVHVDFVSKSGMGVIGSYGSKSGSTNQKVIYTGGVKYIGGSGVPAGKWRAQTVGRGASSQSPDDLELIFDLVRGASDDVKQVGISNLKQVGISNLNGVRVRHYRGTIDINRALAVAPTTSQPALQLIKQLLSQPSIPFEAYVDEQGRLLRLTDTYFERSIIPNAQSRSYHIYYLYDFGKRLDPIPPLESDIIR